MNLNRNDECSNYIKWLYVFPFWVIIGFFILGIILCVLLFYDSTSWSYGLFFLLYFVAILGILAIITLVAMFREISRLHERKFPEDAVTELKKLRGELEKLKRESQKNDESTAPPTRSE